MSKTSLNRAAKGIDNIQVRMYCLGTGDCFVLKFYEGTQERFTAMIDCGSCRGDKAAFQPYVDNLDQYVNGKIDLLIITHEHNDHVNGFAKHPDLFKRLQIGAAWFAWTENPKDPDGRAQTLLKKRSRMKQALSNAIAEIKQKGQELNATLAADYYQKAIEESHKAFEQGLDTLSEINLPSSQGGGQPLAGMITIKEILEEKKVEIRYLNTGETITLPTLPGITFYVLGPPYEKEYMFKDGKEGSDVYRKKLFLHDSSLSVNAFLNLKDRQFEEKDLPFGAEYIVNDPDRPLLSTISAGKSATDQESNAAQSLYSDPKQHWRQIETDWMYSAGNLALRLNTHINNTSLVLALEAQQSKKVLLFPGDAEYGSWESWHLIEKWEKKGKDGKHLVEDLLNRTVFYKVGHHLSYNGTALEKGILMMDSGELAAMATLDRHRIASRWKSTMPNKFLLAELIKRCAGKLFIMDEFEIPNKPSDQLNPATLGKNLYDTGYAADRNTILYKQYTVKL